MVVLHRSTKTGAAVFFGTMLMRSALIGQNQILERNIQRAVCRGEVDMVLGERRE